MQHNSLDQQVVVVFGASSGIGRATALMAAKRGATIVAAGRDRAALDPLAESTSGEVTVGVADAAEADQVEAIAELAVERHGRIDTWAHVAGISAYARFEDMTVEEFRRVVDVDLLGPVWGAKAALPHLRRGGGAYVVVSSEIAKRSSRWPPRTAPPSMASMDSSKPSGWSCNTSTHRYR
jgi:NAD(P)-dependent dehydrogenase (short-subunit alcohol dehydrogenase family)